MSLVRFRVWAPLINKDNLLLTLSEGLFFFNHIINLISFDWGIEGNLKGGSEMELLAVLGIAAMPFGGVGDGFMMGIDFRMSPWESFGAAVLGSLVPIPFLLIVLKELAARFSISKRIANNSLAGKEALLLILVSVPFVPGTAWIGAAAAAASQMPVRKALVIICLGSMISGGITLALSSASMLV